MCGPTFLVAGAARSGTTALVEGLRLHPQVFITQPKEPHYLAFHGRSMDFSGPGDDAAINRVAVTDTTRYLQLFDGAEDKPARGDGSVTTLYYADSAVGEIRRLDPTMRVVVLLREPVERAHSSYMYLKARGVETESHFLPAVAKEPARRAANWHHLWHYTRASHYAEDLKTLQDALGAEQVGVWFYDELVKDFPRVLGEVVQFLGLSQRQHAPLQIPPVNVSGRPRLLVAQKAVRWATNHQTVRSSLKHVLPFRTRERIRRAVLRKEPVPPIARTHLRETFESDLHELRKLLPDKPLPAWVPTSAVSAPGNLPGVHPRSPG